MEIARVLREPQRHSRLMLAASMIVPQEQAAPAARSEVGGAEIPCRHLPRCRV
jgi:hypothetical protein